MSEFNLDKNTIGFVLSELQDNIDELQKAIDERNELNRLDAEKIAELTSMKDAGNMFNRLAEYGSNRRKGKKHRKAKKNKEVKMDKDDNDTKIEIWGAKIVDVGEVVDVDDSDEEVDESRESKYRNEARLTIKGIGVPLKGSNEAKYMKVDMADYVKDTLKNDAILHLWKANHLDAIVRDRLPLRDI